MRDVKPTELRRWMEMTGKNEEFVAGMVGVRAVTIIRFLSGETVPRRILMTALERLIRETPETGDKAVAG